MSQARSSSSTRSPPVRFAAIRRAWCRSSRATRPPRRGCRRSPPRCSTRRPRTCEPRPDGAFDLRWFTPEVEVDLCGHATLASAHVLYETGPARARRRARVPHPRRRAPRHAASPTARCSSTSPPRRPSRATRPPAARRARHREGRVAAHRPASSSCSSCPTPRSCATSRPTSRARRAHRRARRLRDRRRATTASTTSCRAASRPRSASTRTRSPARCTACSAPYWCDRLGKTELRAHQASARGGAMHVRLAGDRTLLIGHAITVLRGELLG